MIQVDTCGEKRYSPLIPALKAFYTTPKGEEIMIVTDNEAVFKDLKEFLAEQSIGFREIYDGERLTLQFISE
jgi:TusA-related sulfurtransferase